MNAKRTVWIDFENNRYFAIPADAVIPEGDLALYTVNGQCQSVEVTAIDPWEVTGAEAQIYFQAGVSELFQQVRGKFLPALDSEDSGELALPLPKEPITINLLSRIFKHLAEALACILTADESQLLTAREHLHSLREEVAMVGIELDITIELLPPIIHSSYLQSSNPDGFHQALKWLRTFADQFERLESGNADDIVQLLAELNELAHTLFKQEETDAERLQRYQETARQSLSKIPRPDVNQILDGYKST